MSMRELLAEGGIYSGVSPLTSNVAVFIVQAIIIIVLSRGLHRLFERIRQPLVIYEIVAGILLGPTAFSRIPHFTDYIFPKSSLPLLKLIADVGMFIYLFTVGMEVDIDRVFLNLKKSASISLTGFILPFALGFAVSKYIYDNLLQDIAGKVPYSSFAVFLGVAMSITSFTVLSRILVEQKLIRLKVGLLVISSAAVDDIVGWSMLALVISLLSVGKSMLNALWVFVTLVAYGAFLLLWFRKLYARFIAFFEKRPNRWGLLFASTFILLMLSAYFTELIGIHAVFGAFLFGLCLPHGSAYAHKVLTRIEDFNATLLVPLYFAYSGLRTDIGSLSNGSAWIALLLAVTSAFTGKLLGCMFAAKISGSEWRAASSIGILMNTKGLTEIVVLNLGMDIGVINVKVFTVMILMTFITTFATTPLVAWCYPMEQRLKDLEAVEEEDRRMGRGQHKEEELHDVVEAGDRASIDIEHKPRQPTFAVEPAARKASHRGSDAVKFSNLSVCVPFQSDDEASDVASFLSLFGSSAQKLRVNALKMVEIGDNGVLGDDHLAAPRSGPSAHEYAVSKDASCNKVASYGRLVASAEIECSLRLSNVKDFGPEISAVASGQNCHMIALPLHRKKDGTISDDFEEVDYVHFVLEIAQASKTPYALFLDARDTRLISKTVFGERICVVHNEHCGLELLALARHLMAKKNTHVDIIVGKDFGDEGDSSAYAIVEDPKDGIGLTRSAYRGEHSTVKFHHIPPHDDGKEVLSFIQSENERDPFSLILFSGDDQVPMGFVDVSTFFGSFGHNLLEMDSLGAALLVLHKPLVRTVDHHTSSRSIIPSFVFANGPKEMVLVGEGKKSFNTNYAAQQGNQSNLSKIFTPNELAKMQEKADAVDAEKKTKGI